jgi:signal peptide peptidase SppA
MFDIKALDNTSWLAEPTRFKQMLEAASRREVPSAQCVEAERAKRMDAAKHVAAKAIRAVKGRVAMIGVYGFLEQHLSFMGYMMGGTSCDEIGVQFDSAVNDPSVSAIVLDVDSPGGTSYGIQELSDKIYNARAKKPCYAIANSVACSAAYWLATSASTFCCTPSGDVGSVGVYQIHVDQSKALEKAGIKVSIVKAGKRKAEGFPTEPLDDDARAAIQASVNETYTAFIAAVARNRHDMNKSDVREKFGQGAVVSAQTALAAGMIDQIRSLESLLSGLGVGASDARSGGTNMMMLRQEQREREAALLFEGSYFFDRCRA